MSRKWVIVGIGCASAALVVLGGGLERDRLHAVDSNLLKLALVSPRSLYAGLEEWSFGGAGEPGP